MKQRVQHSNRSTGSVASGCKQGPSHWRAPWRCGPEVVPARGRSAKRLATRTHAASSPQRTHHSTVTSTGVAASAAAATAEPTTVAPAPHFSALSLIVQPEDAQHLVQPLQPLVLNGHRATPVIALPQTATWSAEPQQQPVQVHAQQHQEADTTAATTEAAAVVVEDQVSKRKQLMNRVVFGVALGVSGGAILTVGQLPFLLLLIGITYQASQEFYGMLTSQGIAKGSAPPSPIVSSFTTVLCTSMALLAYLHKGRSSIVLAVSAFLLLVMQVIATKKPKFAQLASSLFGLFYCGWLPSFWVKMRLLAAAAPMAPYVGWVQGYTAWTVGLVATFTTVACVIAADTGAYFVGKSLGRTKLTDISPKKTVEGAIGGLASSMAVAVGLHKLTHWPATPLAAAGLGVLVFFSSLFGDLIESIMKRDAGMKDSGNLIPGHGGLLDRVDSYMFTGAVSYFYIVFILADFGLA